MFDKQGRYIIEDYATSSTFASFLPGIAGHMGIPAWCFYVNRGQCVCSFGVSDKEHSIMEFNPAHQAYRDVSTTGFRTFLKIDGNYYEPFRNDAAEKKMYIGMNELEIEETNHLLGVKTNVRYFTLPYENVGALTRVVTVTNLTEKAKAVEILDGMPAVMTYGTSQSVMKMIGQTLKAWMQAEDADKSTPYYRVRFSSDDSTVVKKIEEGNFYISIDASGKLLPVIVDPEVVFEYNVALTEAVGFRDNPVNVLMKKKQITQNNVPCGFFGRSETLDGFASTTHYSLIGQAANKDIVAELAAKCRSASFFEEKYDHAQKLVKDLCAVIQTKSGEPKFDAYCEQSYLDNLLRGGFPIVLGDSIYYTYSRKHGDIERDYNFFVMLPEFYSQGNANYRDVNQNRRSDTLFTPYVKDVNIKTFYNLIQLDGFNPLAVETVSFTLNNGSLDKILKTVGEAHREKVAEFLLKPYTPGKLIGFLLSNKIADTETAQEVLKTAVKNSTKIQNASFGEGYWTDHWTYNLDLIEAYLAVYPEDEERLIFEDGSYTYYESRALINPRKKRYCRTENGIRQYNAIDEHTKKNVANSFVKTRYGEGNVYHTNLMSKLFVLAMNKFAALDSHGMGVEMEGGKPGWYDALNGLPGIFGSSLAETYELARLLAFMSEIISKYGKQISIPSEAADFVGEINDTLSRCSEGELSEHGCWDAVNNAKEQYREKTAFGICGDEVLLSADEANKIICGLLEKTSHGIERALKLTNGAIPCFLAYELSEYEENEKDEIEPKKFTPIIMPNFLEGSVRYLKTRNPSIPAGELYKRVKESDLYDAVLKMYKVNGPLDNASYEIGRAKAFTPGWLENESVWLHMEYKYILELLKAGLYREFFAELKNTCIPFLDDKQYGRSPLENSSFIASSANPNDRIHGKGFVARLSGATAEFVNIWQLMMFGKNPFKMSEDGLVFMPQPALPEYLLTADGCLECTLLGAIKVLYTVDVKKDLVPGEYCIEEITLHMDDGCVEHTENGAVVGQLAEAVRDCRIRLIEIKVKSQN